MKTFARPAWDAQGYDAWIVLRVDYRPDLPGPCWTAWISYGPDATRIELGDVFGQEKTAKAEASRAARAHNFVPKGLWKPVVEDWEGP